MSAFLLYVTIVSTGQLAPGELRPDDPSNGNGTLGTALQVDYGSSELQPPPPTAGSTATPPLLVDALAAVTPEPQDMAAERLRSSAKVGEELRPAPEPVDAYGAGVFWNQATSIPWRLGGAAAVITATGFANWNWGSSRFRFHSEGWFGKDTSSLGMDKLGHAYSTYVLTEFLTDGINDVSGERRSTSYTAAVLSMGLMTYIEVFDGFSKDHGFSHEDLAADAAGALLSIARRSIPGLRQKLDFRLLYTPTKNIFRSVSCFPAPHCDRDGQATRTPITDYGNQRYLLALKLSGFEQLRRTPLRLVEVHGGYYARGFTHEEEVRGEPLRRRLFLGVGLNVGELLFPTRPGWLGRAGKSVLEYLQVPYTAVYSK